MLLTFKDILTGPDIVSSLAFNNNLLASGYENGSVSLWCVNENTSPLSLFNSSLPCTSLKFGSDDPHILYAAHGGTVISWDLRKITNPVDNWMVSTDEINSIDLLENESYLATADDTGSINVLSTTTGSVIKTLTKHENICSAVKFRPNRPGQIISTGLDCRLVVSDWRGSCLAITIFEMGDLVDASSYVDLLQRDDNFNLSDTINEDESSSTNDDYTNDLQTSFSDEQESESPGITDTENEHNIASTAVSTNEGHSSLRFASSYSSLEQNRFFESRLMGLNVPLNPPMIHSLACTASGNYVAVGLESSTIELFKGDEKHLKHVQSLFGHRRGISSLLAVEESHLISGGNDCNIFVWELSLNGTGHQIFHKNKICALSGQEMSNIYVADSTPIIKLVDISRT